MEVPSKSLITAGAEEIVNQLTFMQTTFGQLQARTVCATALMLAVTFSAAAADSTFTDANWISMNPSIPGASGGIDAVVADSVGNLYIGGDFSVVGDVIAHGIAKWDGSSWSALGSGTDGEYPYVNTLAVSGSDLFMGGGFSVVGVKL